LLAGGAPEIAIRKPAQAQMLLLGRRDHLHRYGRIGGPGRIHCPDRIGLGLDGGTAASSLRRTGAKFGGLWKCLPVVEQLLAGRGQMKRAKTTQKGGIEK